ncbi:MAG: transporter [Balneolaceae bacterium]|nr:transporter [Balneolaceae bacterium]
MLITFSAVHAQDKFSPDRPGLGNGTYVLQPKATYLETGVEYFEGGPVDQFSFGQVMFRHGILPGAELRVQLNSFVVQTQPRPLGDKTGMPDPGIGLKVDLMNRTNSPFRLSGLGSITIPAGYSPFSNDNYHPSGTLLADYQLSTNWSLSANLGYTFGPVRRSDMVTLTITPGFSVPDSDVSGYFGYASFLTGNSKEHFVETGLTKMINSSLQIDVNGGYDLNSGNSFIGAGLAVKF